MDARIHTGGWIICSDMNMFVQHTVLYMNSYYFSCGKHLSSDPTFYHKVVRKLASCA
jgi:hypothetical protein